MRECKSNPLEASDDSLSRAGKEGPESFHIHKEGPYLGLFLVESGYYYFPHYYGIFPFCEGMLPALSLSDWIGGLFPLVAVESIIADCVGVAELEVEGAL